MYSKGMNAFSCKTDVQSVVNGARRRIEITRQCDISRFWRYP